MSLLFSFSFLAEAIGQEKPRMEIGPVKENSKKIYFTLTSSKPFIVGDNVYVLHIGGKAFWLYDQSGESDKKTITFFIPENDFNGFGPGSSIYLTYGNRSMEEEEMKEMSTLEYGQCWSLGQFSKTLLTK